MDRNLRVNEEVRSYWEERPCGVAPAFVDALPERTREWFERIEEYRYKSEPFIHSVAQFTRHHGKAILEVGVGTGTDHLQWARAGACCSGVDLTDSAIEITNARLSLYGFKSDLQRVDAEHLPYGDDTFDLVYSWGVIHHSARPELIVHEVRRVLKSGGEFIGMVYHRPSVAAFNLWMKYGLLKGKPWHSFTNIISRHVESKGTKAYSIREVRNLLAAFSSVSTHALITPYDRDVWPAWLSKFFPDAWGWFLCFHTQK